jgi:hypothetical protein
MGKYCKQIRVGRACKKQVKELKLQMKLLKAYQLKKILQDGKA